MFPLLLAGIVRIAVQAIGRSVAVAVAIPSAALVGPLVVLVHHPAVGRVAIALALGDEMACDPLVLAVSPHPYARYPDIAFTMLDALGAARGRRYVAVHVVGEG